MGGYSTRFGPYKSFVVQYIEELAELDVPQVKTYLVLATGMLTSIERQKKERRRRS